jgi:Raf kinase inhibitor-like YbhB/YbcL family protein
MLFKEALMKLWSDSFEDNAQIPERFAFGKKDATTHVTLSDNLSPHFAWSDVPDGTKSFALICHDPDVPSVGDDVNQEGKAVSSDLPRVNFFHWSMVDLDAQRTLVAEGIFATGVTAKGKNGPSGPLGTRQAINDYTKWFDGDADMGGEYFGYDGPCPPWNDEILHHYVFTLYALDVEKVGLDGTFDGPMVMNAIEGHILGKASITGTYSLNPNIG